MALLCRRAHDLEASGLIDTFTPTFSRRARIGLSAPATAKKSWLARGRVASTGIPRSGLSDDLGLLSKRRSRPLGTPCVAGGSSPERHRRCGAMAGVVFQRVAKVYRDGTRAVDDLSLDIRDGEFVVIVGPSGSGKTTALRLVAGLEEIGEGTMAIGDRVVCRGRLQQFAPPQEVYARPAKRVRRRVHRIAGNDLPRGHGSTLERRHQRPAGRAAPCARRLGSRATTASPRVRGGTRDRRHQTREPRTPRLYSSPRIASSMGQQLREALGPELLVHFTAPRVQPAETESIADLPRDESTMASTVVRGRCSSAVSERTRRLGNVPRSTPWSIPTTCISRSRNKPRHLCPDKGGPQQ